MTRALLTFRTLFRDSRWCFAEASPLEQPSKIDSMQLINAGRDDDDEAGLA